MLKFGIKGSNSVFFIYLILYFSVLLRMKIGQTFSLTEILSVLYPVTEQRYRSENENNITVTEKKIFFD